MPMARAAPVPATRIPRLSGPLPWGHEAKVKVVVGGIEPQSPLCLGIVPLVPPPQ